MLRIDASCFVCICWGDKYGARYVDKLRAGLRRNCGGRLPFICVTDRPEIFAGRADIEVVSAKPDAPGWWQKISLFDEAFLSYRFRIFFDLDVVILRSLDGLLSTLEGTEFAYAQDVLDVMSSSFMFIDSASPLARDVTAGFVSKDWITLENECDQSYLGPFASSGRYRTRALPAKDHFSYKYLIDYRDWRVRSRNPAYHPVDLREVLMLNFHGEPKPHQLEAEPGCWPLSDKILPHW